MGVKTATNQQIKGLSPKLVNQSPGSNNITTQQRNNSNGNPAPKYSSLMGTFGSASTSEGSDGGQHPQSHSAKPPQSMLASRSRNSTMNNGQGMSATENTSAQAIAAKHQFSSMRSGVVPN